MGALIRLIIGVPGAVIVTVALFLFMSIMIAGDVRLEEEKVGVNIDITAQLDDSDLNDANQDMKRPTLDTPPPPPPAVNDPSNRPELDGARAIAPALDVNLSIGAGFNPDRDAQPLVRIPPTYPDRCQGRASSMEAVTVQFDVTPEGATTNIVVIDATSRCFNSAAVRSVGRWKYQPKIVDNQPQWRRGVVTTIEFQLEE
ncbi:MAG: TonB family protein [Marinicaulis sp.]|nr:TonB family protein [Marinicaulis sp.]